MAEIINFNTKSSWNSMQDIEESASPAGMTRATEVKIHNFNVNERLKNLSRGRMVHSIYKSERLAA
ncbi:hypothetical protein IJI00_02380 [Candidatus Saccharibacteria bacterium]|nr:hypothetical protein [Candidatus Saccharibacteria bacterium]MBR3264039.1 hypothetical protein [Candidatus Saccharibacteria bacterium]